MIWDRLFRENDDILSAIAISIAERQIRLREIQYPNTNEIYKCLEFNEPKDVKVIIVGQEPFAGAGEANGLAFSVNKGAKIPPTVRNILKELKNDLGIESDHGDFTPWAKQGVLLLNRCLTVKKDSPGSHADIGWEMFTDEIIRAMSKEGDKVFVLWGKKMLDLLPLIDAEKNRVLVGTHPGPSTAAGGFFNSKPFSLINSFLDNPIDWSLDDHK